MYDSHMPRERVVARERLLFATHRASDLLLTTVVNGILVTSKIVGSREDRVAGLVR